MNTMISILGSSKELRLKYEKEQIGWKIGSKYIWQIDHDKQGFLRNRKIEIVI